jgi:nitroimidazol reductase NimA-like FMN-containing flavoprotein (pyridoxamine 5'-phosphate oxidase superfamily)
MSEVRRKDYEQRDEAEILAFLDRATHGFLGFVRPDGSPGMVAVNFVCVGETIYFHGALEGEKMRSLAVNASVVLMVADDFSLIPSFFRVGDLACPATQYYKAVVVRGEARMVTSREERALALQALMEKLQPQGGYRPISATDPRYRKSLDTTAVVAVPMTEVTAKFKFGQNLPRRTRARVARQLRERDGQRDGETAEAMREVCPF